MNLTSNFCYLFVGVQLSVSLSSQRSRLLLGEGKVSISISESSSSLNRRVDEFVLFNNTGVEDDDDGGGVISTECCRATGISGMKALDDWFELTNVDGIDDGDGVE